MARPARNAATINTETKTTVAEVEETTATVETVEEVKGAEEVKAEVEETKPENGMPFTVKDGKVKCVSEKRAGKTIFAITGAAITFDADGSATVSVEDAMYLSKCPGFNFK